MKIKIAKVICIFFLFQAFSSCKKDKATEPSPPKTPAPTEPQPETPPSRIDGSTTAFFNFIFKRDSTGLQYGYIHASFYNMPYHLDSLPRFSASDDVGDIRLNGKAMQKNNNTMGLVYSFSPNTLEESYPLLNTRNWHILGNEHFKEIEFSDKTPIPEFLSDVALPDTIYKYKNNVIKIGTINGADSAMIHIRERDGPNSSATKTINRFQKELVFSKEDFYSILPFDQFDFVEIELTILQESYQIINGKAFRHTFYITYTSEPIPFKANA